MAPGFWRCSSVVVTVVGGPGLTDPSLGPPAIRQERVCGVEYQESSSEPAVTAECSCGTFAIGRCAGCRRFVCGVHSAMHAGRRLCGHCLNEEQATSAAREAERRKSALDERMARYEASMAVWEQEVAKRVELAREVRDPIERLLLAVTHWVGGDERPEAPGTRMAIRPSMFSDALPELWPSAADVNLNSASPPWDSPAIARWFAARMRRVAKPKERRAGPVPLVKERGWCLNSTGTHTYKLYDAYPTVWNTVWVTAGGWLRGEGALGVTGLQQMAQHLGLSAPELRPPVPPKQPR